ncbi:RusA family crossover junction endodeoxyribonuclease [Stenotrophomonas maltophilia]|uniref:RusA family crossover junction endodeoxyribonuclease n=1 Tax=Stenotrophomonas maltophilia TaxID=40324 RepID=UPI002154F98B|nr:RusA family crossover junction endodeoxyribonuclease [Stenotrophomonas maltophilia]
MRIMAIDPGPVESGWCLMLDGMILQAGVDDNQALLAMLQGWELHMGDALAIRLYPNLPQDWAKRARKDPHTWDDTVQCIDLGNCEKVLSDALNGVAWVDDKKHRRILLERMEPDAKGARVELVIEHLAAAPSLFGEAAA